MAFFRLQRARAVDEQATRPHQFRRVAEQTGLQLGQPLDILGTLQTQDIGMPADRARREAWRIEHNGIELLVRLPGRDVGLDDFGFEVQPRKVLAQPPQTLGRNIDGCHMRARSREFTGLAARRGAQVGNLLSRHIAEQLHRQRRSGILNPPRALGKARQVLNTASILTPDRTGRQHQPFKLLRPMLGIALGRDIQRRFPQRGFRDGARQRLTIGGRPALPQPVGNVQAHGILRRRDLQPALRNTAQHGVRQAVEPACARIGPRLLDSQIDHRMRGDAEKHELRRRRIQDRPQRATVRRQRTIDERIDDGIELAEAAHHGRRDQARQSAIIGGQRTVRCVTRCPRQRVVKRATLGQDGSDQIHGQLARRQSGRRMARRVG